MVQLLHAQGSEQDCKARILTASHCMQAQT